MISPAEQAALLIWLSRQGACGVGSVGSVVVSRRGLIALKRDAEQAEREK